MNKEKIKKLQRIFNKFANETGQTFATENLFQKTINILKEKEKEEN